MANSFSESTRDFGFLEGIAGEWAEIRRATGLGPKAKECQIDKCWDQIFGPASGAYPKIGRLHAELFADRALRGSIRANYWKVRPRARCGYKCDEILGDVLWRLFWTVVRNAHTWSDNKRPTDEHWARFWNDTNLQEEIRRACRYRYEREGPQQLPKEAVARNIDPDPEQVAELLDLACQGMSSVEQRAFREWYSAHNTGDVDDSAIAKHHGMTVKQLNKVVRRGAETVRRDVASRRASHKCHRSDLGGQS